jgi:hypothetical protein
VNTVASPDLYCVDLNDNLLDAGDEIQFFYCAKNTVGIQTYAFGSNLGAQGSDREEAAVNSAEFSILPVRGNNTGTRDILYVDGMDGRGAQPYWDTAFAALNLSGDVDRFDVRGPTSSAGNHPAGRVKNVSQLLGAYKVILWDAGDLEVGLGNGSGAPEKTNDYKLVRSFLDNLTNVGGVYICGDDVGSVLDTYQSSSNPNGVDAIVFKSTYLPFNLTSSSQKNAFGISPVGVSVPSGCFVSDASRVLYGGCPLINDFDVFEPQGTTKNEITYGPGTATSANGAVIGRIFNNGSTNVGIMLGGFSFIYIRDDDTNGVMDRATFLHDVLAWLAALTIAPTPVVSVHFNRLDQNYPNPFNPQTTIAFSLKQRTHAQIVVYDVAGARVRTLADESFAAGAHQKVWDGRNDAGAPVASGVYFYQLVANEFTQTRKMVLLK